MNSFFKIIGKLTKVTLALEDKNEILFFLESLKNNHGKQQDFFFYCEKRKIAAWIYVRLKKELLLSFFTTDTLALFSKEYEIILKQNNERNEQAVQVLEEFKKDNIDVIILKGNVFTQTIYNDFGYKRMNDFDILIKKEDWSKIQDIYFKLGFIPLGFGWTGEKHKATNFSHTGIPYMSRNLKCMIGSQWGLKAPTAHYKVNMDELWETAEPHEFIGVKVKKLSPKYNLLHLILHLGTHKCGVRDCMDIYNLLLVENIDESELKSLFIKTKCLDKAFFALSLCHNMSNVPNNNLLEKFENNTNSYLKNKLKKRLESIYKAEDWYISYNDYFQDIEKNVVYSNIFHSFNLKLVLFFKVLKQLFLPRLPIGLQFIEKAHQPTFWHKTKVFFTAPYCILLMLKEEIGLKVTFLILVKLFANLLLSPLNYFKPKETYFDYLIKKGIDPQTIKNIVSNVQ